jgi:hypothetical protein
MILLKEHINEKFEEDTDPIQDLGIGIFVKRSFKTREDMYEWICKHLVDILDPDRKLDDILKDILDMPGKNGSFLGTKYTNKLVNFVRTYLHVVDETPTNIAPDPFHRFLKRKYPHIRSWQYEGEGYYEGKEKQMNEKFIENSDPIQDLGIGLEKALLGMIKNIFLIDQNNQDIEHLTNEGNIQTIFNDGKMFSIEFYSNKYFYNTGKVVDKKQYSIQLLKMSELSQFVNIIPAQIEPPEDEFESDSEYSSWLFMFRIKKEYRSVFKKIAGEFKPPKI